MQNRTFRVSKLRADDNDVHQDHHHGHQNHHHRHYSHRDNENEDDHHRTAVPEEYVFFAGNCKNACLV